MPKKPVMNHVHLPEEFAFGYMIRSDPYDGLVERFLRRVRRSAISSMHGI